MLIDLHDSHRLSYAHALVKLTRSKHRERLLLHHDGLIHSQIDFCWEHVQSGVHENLTTMLSWVDHVVDV